MLLGRKCLPTHLIKVLNTVARAEVGSADSNQNISEDRVQKTGWKALGDLSHSGRAFRAQILIVCALGLINQCINQTPATIRSDSTQRQHHQPLFLT